MLVTPGNAAALDFFCRVLAKFGEFDPPASPVAAHVKHDPGAGPRLPVHREAGQFLQRLQDLTMRADEFLQSRTDHGHEGPVALDIHVDVAIEVRHVQQALDIVGGYLALLLEIRQVHLSGGLSGLGRRGIFLVGLIFLVVRLVGCDVVHSHVQVVRRHILRAAEPGTHRFAARARQCLACSITAGDGARILRLAHHRGSSSFRVLTCPHDNSHGRARPWLIACPSAGYGTAAPAAA